MKNKMSVIDVDLINDFPIVQLQEKYNLIFTVYRKDENVSRVNAYGHNEDLIKFLKGDEYYNGDDNIEAVFPELFN